MGTTPTTRKHGVCPKMKYVETFNKWYITDIILMTTTVICQNYMALIRN